MSETAFLDDDTIIWRYMDFARFVDVIENRRLWFARADTFDDPLEGYLTTEEVRVMSAFMKGVNRPEGVDPRLALMRTTEALRECTYINCWRMGPHESLAMWSLYGKGSGIVALKSTIGKLRQVLAECSYKAEIAPVQYFPLQGHDLGISPMKVFTRKDISFLHEGELRAIITGDLIETLKSKRPSSKALSNTLKGMTVSIDPDLLITEIVVGPNEKLWVSSLVRVLKERYSLRAEVFESTCLRPLNYLSIEL